MWPYRKSRNDFTLPVCRVCQISRPLSQPKISTLLTTRRKGRATSVIPEPSQYNYKPFDQFVAQCQLRIYQHQEQYIAIVTATVDNKEISITSYWPELAYEIADQYNLPLAQTCWLEHYP